MKLDSNLNHIEKLTQIDQGPKIRTKKLKVLEENTGH